MRIKRIRLDELRLDDSNVIDHGGADVTATARSLFRFGQLKPIVVSKDKWVAAGNGTVLAARKLGWTEIECSVSDLSEVELRAYSIADNKTGRKAEWDLDNLAARLEEVAAEDLALLEATAFESDELAELLEQWEEPIDWGSDLEAAPEEPPEVPDVEPQTDRAEELRQKWQTEAGQLWVIPGAAGEHRLLCGDCRDRGQVEGLVNGVPINVAFTSPPYASQRKYDESSGFKPIPPDDYVEWWEPVQDIVKRLLAEDGSFFVNIKPCAEGLDTDLYVMDFVIAHARRWGWHFATEFCWERVGIPQQVVRRFKNQFEPIYQFTPGNWKIRPEAVQYAAERVPIAQGKGAGDTNAAKRQGVCSAVEGNEVAAGMAYPGNRLPVFSSSEPLGHSAVFPVGLPSFFIKAYSDPSDLIYDPFLGSGTTMLAAEQLGRICYGMEISPAYCAVILQRMADAGLSPRLEG